MQPPARGAVAGLLAFLAALVISFVTDWGVLPDGCGFAIQFALGAATTASAPFPQEEAAELTLIGVLVV